MSDAKKKPPSEEEAKMMAEWEAMAGGDIDTAATASGAPKKVGDDGRILDQTEIDSLLGFGDDSGKGHGTGSGSVDTPSVVAGFGGQLPGRPPLPRTAIPAAFR